MNILVIGSGGREHALCVAFKRSSRVGKIYCAPGNAGIAEIAETREIAADDVEKLAVFAEEMDADLTFVGGETSLAAGIVDVFELRGLRIIGPTQAAAQLEASKAFAKDIMRRHAVPTARYEVAGSIDEARQILMDGAFGPEDSPVVVKADGLAGGKGVVVAPDRATALSALSELGGVVGDAAVERIVLEECLFGSELSLLAFADGEDFALMPPTRDHKRIGDGDTGPNTGGMGTFTDDALLTEEQLTEIVETIIRPTLRGCVADGLRFRGVLFVGLMMTADGPKVLEYNVRFGDPETQSILVRLETDLVDICEAMLDGRLPELPVEWKKGSSATVVLAAEGYPASARKGDAIHGLDVAARCDGVTIFHAGTGAGPEGDGYFTSGGRVLSVTAVGKDLGEALARSYAAVEKISWDGMQYRRDIGRTV